MPDKPTNTDGIQISCSTQTSCSRCYTANNKQNSLLITDSSPQSCHKQAVRKYITYLPMEINMKNFYYRIPSTHAVNNALISSLQIDYYTIHKIQPSNIKTKPSQKRKEIIESTLFFRISLHSFDFSAISIFSSFDLELQLGHPITTDLQQEFGILVTNNSQALIYYGKLTVFFTIASTELGRASQTFALFTKTRDKTKEHHTLVNNDHHD